MLDINPSYYSDEPVSQHSIGELYPNSSKRDRSWNNGQLAIGEVIKVHKKRYTADVKIIKTQDDFTSPDSQEGRYSCRISSSTAGYSETYQMPYGEILPIYAGDLVLVGFLGNSTEQPVILKVFHDISESVGDANYRNILPNKDEFGDVTDYLKISPIQDYMKIKENGNFERVSHTKSFIIGTDEEIDEENFDFEDLSVKYPTDKTVVNPNAHMDTRYDKYNPSLGSGNTSGEEKTIHVKESDSKPKTYLAVFRDKFNDTVTNWLRFIINSAQTSLRIIQSKRNFSGSSKGAATSISLNTDGSVVIRRQTDTRTIGHEFESEMPKQYSEIIMDKDGAVTIQTLDQSNSGVNSTDYPRTLIHMYPKGGMLSLYTTSKLSINAKDGINMISDNNITIASQKAVAVTSKQGTQITSEQNIVMNTKTDVSISATSSVNTQSASVITSGSQERYGSDKTVGGTTKIGSLKTIGSMSVNSCTLVARGDRDTHGYSNMAIKGNRVVAALQTFVMNKAMDMATNAVMQNIPGAAAMAGLIQMGSGLYSNFQGMSFNDISTNLAGVATGTIIGQASPFYGQLSEYANIAGVDITSVTGQMDFLSAPIGEGGLGIDLTATLSGDLPPFEGTLKQASELWESFGKKNVLETQLGNSLGDSSEGTLSDSEKESMMNGCGKVTCEIVPSMFNPDIGGDSLSEDPKEMVPISSLIKENQVITETKSSGGSSSGSTTTKRIATIEDALDSVAKYCYPNGWQAEVKKISEQVDREQGTNSLQYYNVNRKQTFSSSGGSSGTQPEYTSKPLPVSNKDQYLDRVAKRYVYNNAVKVVELANSSWINYTVNEQIQFNGMNGTQIQRQEQQYNAIYNN